MAPPVLGTTECSLQSVTGGTSSGSPAAITRDAAWTIAIVTNSDGSHGWAQLPSGCSAGDIVEVYWVDNGVNVLPPSGETFVDGSAHFGTPAFFRKITGSVWSIIT